MADYYPLIARAIAGLDPSAPGESRRALYERARAALIAQLRSVQPPLSESEITRERLSLEEAVREVESEAAQRARDATRPGGDATRSADGTRAGGDRPRAGDSFRANIRPTPRPGEPPSASLLQNSLSPPSASQPSTSPPSTSLPSPPPRPRPPSTLQPRNERPPLGLEQERPDARPPRNLRADAPPIPRPQPPQSQPQVSMQDPQLPPTRERPAAPRPRQRRLAGAGAGDARFSRYRRRRRRSRPRRGASQPLRAKNLCQCAVALAGIRPARAQPGKPRRRSRCALFL